MFRRVLVLVSGLGISALVVACKPAPKAEACGTAEPSADPVCVPSGSASAKAPASPSAR